MWRMAGGGVIDGNTATALLIEKILISHQLQCFTWDFNKSGELFRLTQWYFCLQF